MKLLFLFLFWFIYFPLLRLIVLLGFWHPKIKERLKFEKKNKFEWLAHSFKERNLKADLCFEFSSEGEYQQVASLVEDALKLNQRIELVFFSPSVEKTILDLADRYPTQIRYFRYPLLRFFPFIRRRSFSQWMSAPVLILVRYDFFPEFLIWSMSRAHQMKILWVTFKKERLSGSQISFWKKKFLKQSRLLIFASEMDLSKASSCGVDGVVYDFRMEQIRRRISVRNEKLNRLNPPYLDLLTQVRTWEHKIILGNAWPSDLFLLENLPKDIPLVIVPHSLDSHVLNEFQQKIKSMNRDFFEISDQTNHFKVSSIYLIKKKGILCELYADFSKAYVGGGFEGSIHSVLEPLIAGCDKIASGPAHHRSTEFDVAVSCGKMTEVQTPVDFYQWIFYATPASNHDKIISTQGYENFSKLVLEC